MTLEIEVMYADLSRQRRPLDEAAKLKRTGVLFIILSAPTTEKMARRWIGGVPCRRARQVWGTDFYALLRYRHRHPEDICDRDAVCLWGWDSGEYPWTRVDDPHGENLTSCVPCSLTDIERLRARDKITWPPWMPEDALIFVGAALDGEAWRAALDEFEREMH